jgi:hypothetical protein
VQICIQPACLFYADKESNMAFILKERNSIHHGFCCQVLVCFEIWEECWELCSPENETFKAANFGKVKESHNSPGVAQRVP